MDNEKEETLKFFHDLAKQNLKEANKYKEKAKRVYNDGQIILTKAFLIQKKMYERNAKLFSTYEKILEQKGKEFDFKKAKQDYQALLKANEEKRITNSTVIIF